MYFQSCAQFKSLKSVMVVGLKSFCFVLFCFCSQPQVLVCVYAFLLCLLMCFVVQPWVLMCFFESGTLMFLCVRSVTDMFFSLRSSCSFLISQCGCCVCGFCSDEHGAKYFQMDLQVLVLVLLGRKYLSNVKINRMEVITWPCKYRIIVSLCLPFMWLV